MQIGAEVQMPLDVLDGDGGVVDFQDADRESEYSRAIMMLEASRRLCTAL